MDMTYVVAGAILLVGALLASLASYAWSKWIQPWIEEHHLEEEAAIVGNAVEAILGRYQGQAKWELALKKMEERGWNINVPVVIDAVKAAWQALDLKQIAAGVKAPECYETGAAEEEQ